MASDTDDKNTNLSPSETYLEKCFTNLSHFQYDKAKTSLEKLKENHKLWNLFQSAIGSIVNGEKSYNNLQFLNQKSLSKQDKNFEPAIMQLEQIVKECNLLRSSSDGQTIPVSLSFLGLNGLVNTSAQLIHMVNLRFQMMSLYTDLKEKEKIHAPNNHVEFLLRQLNDIEEKFNKTAVNMHLINRLKTLYNSEIELLKNLLECHLAIDLRLDCIKSLTNLKDIGDLFDNRLPVGLNNKQSKESKGFSIFSRNTSQQKTLPVLYQWFRIYYQALLNKRITDVDHIMNEKIDVYSKLIAHFKKTGPHVTGILMDSVNICPINFRGNGYEMLHLVNNNSNSNEKAYPILFSFPKFDNPHEIEKHMKNLISFVNELDMKVKYFYDQNLKSTYYMCKVSDALIFFLIYELNKQENKAKTSSFVQEIGDDLNLNNVFNCFNSNLK